MKNYLLIACSVVALVGCARNQGGVDNDSPSQTGYDGNYRMPKSSESGGVWTNGSTAPIDRSGTTTSPEIQSPSEQKD